VTDGAPSPLRDLTYYATGPVVLVLVVTGLFQLHPWPVPIPAQAWNWTLSASYLSIATVCVWLSSRAGLASAPSLRDWPSWRALLLWSVPPGLAWGAGLLALDALTHFTRNALRISWMNVALPASIGHYAAAAVAAEIPLRTVPLPLLLWLVGVVLLRGRGRTQVFWVFAILTSLIEPAGMLTVAMRLNAPAIAFLGLAFVANLEEAVLFRRFGWPAPIAFRAGLYAVWHVFGPYLFAPTAFLYPGPH
jgi:hypothetical protein